MNDFQIQIVSVFLGLLVAALFILTIEFLFPKIYKAIRRVRLWWVSGKWRMPEQIEFRTGRGLSYGRPAGVRGMFLLVVTDRGQEMVSAGAALDRELFWKTWKYLGGQADGWVDEETGEEIDITEL